MPTSARAARAPVTALLALAAFAAGAGAQGRLTSPQEQFGHAIGADYRLPDYQQLTEYWRKLDAESDRMTLVDIGKTAEGRSQWMAVVTSPANHARLEQLRLGSERLARGRVTEDEARALARDGKTVVWIDGGLHANEVLGAQQLMETLWQLVSRNDDETRRILDDVVVLFVHANPDGMDLVSQWYTRQQDTLKRSTAYIPRLYQKYIGHDNNRDFYASTQPETENMNRVMYHAWYPQIVYNHHQTGPTGTVMFAPPFRDPFNYVFDPLLVAQLDMVGAAMHARFTAEDKPGVVTRRGANYSTWWNGGLRTTTYFHNMIGLLTETIGNPTPMQIPFVANRQLASTDLIYPIQPQTWHFRQSIDYSVTANYAILDYAQRYRERLLLNTWRMARNSIERGSEDTWTVYPSRVDSVRAAMQADRRRSDADGMAVGGLMQDAADSAASRRYQSLLRRPEWRDPRGYIISADQPDFPTAVKFVNTLRENGIEVQRATRSFTVAGKTYPAGSLVVKTAQAFRPHVIDMFEPQDHPNDFRYEGGPPIPPYDNAGWTLAYQMGVKFDRILESFDGPFEAVTEWNIAPPAARIAAPRWAPAGYAISPRQVDAFAAVQALLASGAKVSRVTRPTRRGDAHEGDFFVELTATSHETLQGLAQRLGVDVEPVHTAPAGMTPLRAPRIALWDRYGGSMPSGWTRYIFDQWGIPYTVVFAPELDAGNLNAKYDVIIFVDGGIPERDRGGRGGMPDAADVPAEFRAQLGNVSVARTVPQLKTFLENGGTVVTVGGSTILAKHLGLPVENQLVERAADGTERELGPEKYYIPGSLLQVRVDTTADVTAGMPERVDVMFDNSPVFRLGADAASRGVRRLAWFDSPRPLRSGWAWGQQYLDGGVAAAEADVGRGTLFLFGPEITFRAQPHATFKLLFNAIYDAAPAR